MMHLLAQAEVAAATPGTAPTGLVTWVVLISTLALLPFLLAMVTSFAKLVIVGGILKQALGTQQVPPTTVITGIAILLTAHIMFPVYQDAETRYHTAAAKQEAAAVKAGEAYDDGLKPQALLEAAVPALTRFMTQHASEANVQLMADLGEQVRVAYEQGDGGDTVEGEALTRQVASHPESKSTMRDELAYLATTLAPAFMLTELTEAFIIGFLLFVPFVVIDLVVSNVLLAMGMHMLTPVTVALPLKLLLFVLVDGWTLVVQGLVLGYA